MVRKFWAESGPVKRLVTICAVIASVGMALSYLKGWAQTPTETYLAKWFDSTTYHTQIDSLAYRVDTLEHDTVSRRELESKVREIQSQLASIQTQTTESATKVDMIYDLLKEMRR